MPGITKQRLVDEHYARYNFALDFVDKGSVVLDIACGVGYGSHILAAKAERVVGVDISEESIKFAKKNYGAKNIEYILSSAGKDIFSDNSFDIICSFETIEHLEDGPRKKYLFNLAKWLKPGGVLLLSTPNKKITSPFSEKPLNKFHVLEYTRENLLNEASAYLEVKEVFGQRPIKKIYTKYLVRRVIGLLSRVSRFCSTIYTIASDSLVSQYDQDKYEPRIFVLVCKKK